MNLAMPLRRHICFLDVGHGNSTVIIAGEDSVVVVDVGRQSTLSEFLNQQKITHIRTVYLSHADADHIGALAGILATQAITIGRVIVNSDSKNTEVWDDLLYELDRAHHAGSLEFKLGLVSGHSEMLDGHVSIDVVGPSRYLAGKGPGSTLKSGSKVRTNSVSAILAVSVNSSKIALLPGDMDDVGLYELLRRSPDLNAPILVYPHHGCPPRAGSDLQCYMENLLKEVKPELVIFSIGRGVYSTPSPETVRLLRRLCPKARIVCTQLSEHCASRLPKAAANQSPLAFARGREHGKCCGGTVVVSLDDVSTVQPQRDAHFSFIRHYAPTALCSGDCLKAASA